MLSAIVNLFFYIHKLNVVKSWYFLKIILIFHSKNVLMNSYGYIWKIYRDVYYTQV